MKDTDDEIQCDQLWGTGLSRDASAALAVGPSLQH